MLMELKNISFAYQGASNIFSNISFSVDKGEVISILGPNGVGKTTLLNCMGSLAVPTNGEILIEGKSMRSMSSREIGMNIGFVPQFIIPSFAYEVLDYVVTGCDQGWEPLKSQRRSTMKQQGSPWSKWKYLNFPL